MATNPLIDQGVLNRLRGSVVWVDNPNLNVTAPYLGREGIRLALEGEATTFINTMTGAVTSGEPYQKVSLTLHLLKPQNLANLYKAQQELNSVIGNGTVRPDVSSGLGSYQLVNCAIQTVRELNFSGDDAGFAVTIGGYYEINSSLWDF
jgi:hypothetical protein